MQTHNDPAFQFAHLPSYAILTLLPNKPHSVNNSGFYISQGDIELYHTLNSGLLVGWNQFIQPSESVIFT